MIFAGRARLLGTRGAVTVVRSFDATADDRGRALDPGDACDVLLALCREAETGGDRHPLVDVHQVLDGVGSTRYWTVATSELAQRILDAVMRGELLVLDGWLMGDRWTSASRSMASGPEVTENVDAKVVRRLMGRRSELAFEGGSYLLIPALSWAELTDRGDLQVVRQDEATMILRRMADRTSVFDEKAAVVEAVGLLADTGRPRIQGGLFLVRRVQAGWSTKTADEPAMTPSQMRRRAAVEKTHWIEIEVVDEDGRPCPGEVIEVVAPDGAALRATTDDAGQVRFDGLAGCSGCKSTLPAVNAADWEVG